MLYALALGALVTGIYYTIMVHRVLRARASIRPLREGLDAPEPEGGWPSVCVVVPAHNEEDVAGDLAASLRAQDYPALRVVFALDRCADETERVVREAIGSDERFEIVTIDECPGDWAGKTHAAWRGLTRSRAGGEAELLLFTDADTLFEPECVRACVATLLREGSGMLSVLSQLSHDYWFERLVQPASALELMRQHPLERVNRIERRRSFANGQFMLFRREVYEALGGHERVRDALLEDLAFARLLAKSLVPVRVLFADGLLHCRMYRSWAEYQRGWKRIFTEAARRRPLRLARYGLRMLVSTVAAPIISAAAVVAGAASLPTLPAWAALLAGAYGLVSWGLIMGGVWRMQRAPLWLLPLAPVGGALTAAILFGAAMDLWHRRGITWAGRTYEAKAVRRPAAEPSRST